MASGHVALSWAPGDRLFTTSENSPDCTVDVLPTLPAPVLQLYFKGHLCFRAANMDCPTLIKNYLSMLDVCIDNLRLSSLHDHQSLADQFEEVRIVWSLVHHAHFSKAITPQQHISYFLNAWYFENFGSEKPCYGKHNFSSLSDKEAWKYVTDLVLCGDVDKANQFLVRVIQHLNISHDDWQRTIARVRLGQYDQISEDLPAICLVHAFLDAAPFKNPSCREDNTWTEWQHICETWSESPTIKRMEEARKLLLVMAGDPSTISDLCDSWEQTLVATSTYIANGVSGGKAASLTTLTDICVVASTLSGPPASAGGALVDAVMGRFKEVAIRFDVTLPTSWASVHLCDALMRANIMKGDADPELSKNPHIYVSVHEFFLRKYAASLERYPTCWRIAVDYLYACEDHGTGVLKGMIDRLPFSGCGDRNIEKALCICYRRNLNRTAAKLCERVGVNCAHNRDFGGAMEWLCKANSTRKCIAAAESALKLAEMEGPNSYGAKELLRLSEALNTYGEPELMDRLSFVVAYQSMQKAKANILPEFLQDSDAMKSDILQFQDAVDQLLSGRLIGREFWCVIAYEAAQMLELCPAVLVVFSRKCLSQLITAVEISSGPYRDEGLFDGIRKRIAYEALPTDEKRKPVELCSLERAGEVLGHCRKVFLDSFARKFNGPSAV